MKRTSLLVGLLAVAALAGGLAWRGGWLPIGTPKPGAVTPTGGPGAGGPPGGGGGRRGGATFDGPTPVVVAPVERRDVDLSFDGIGTVQASASVTVRPQVDGTLIDLPFREGQEVRRGDVIARIDPASYKAIWDQAVARRDQDAADLANARADLERYIRLAQSESGSRQQADTQRATVAKLEAQIRIDQGVIDKARVDLDNTTILAPIDGRTGIRTLDMGNLVHAADQTGLVTIAQLKPITVSFTLPQQQLAAVLAAEAKGVVAVEVLDATRNASLDRGVIEVIDNLVDSTTGTVKIKATLPNDATRLWPGQFVDVRVRVETTKGALVVPSAAVQRSTDGAFVWVLGDEDKVKRRPIEVVRQDEVQALIGSGLEQGETVVTTGFTRLVDGTKVRPSRADASAPTTPAGAGDATPAVKPRGEKRSGNGAGGGTRQRPDHTGQVPAGAPVDVPPPAAGPTDAPPPATSTGASPPAAGPAGARP